MADWYCNGEALRKIPIDDRGFQYGDGLFETVAIREGEPRLWPLHIDRLQQGCAALNITLPSPEYLTAGLKNSVSSSRVSSGFSIVKLIVTAGGGERGYGRSKVEPMICFGVFDATPAARSVYSDGIKTTLCNTRLASHSPTAGLKTLCRTEQVLARSEIVDTAVFEGFTMDTADQLICGTMSNVFFVRGSTISTPPVDSNGVAGVMRRHVMNCLDAVGREVAEKVTRREDLEKFDEVFITNSQLGVVPVAECDDIRWNVGQVTCDIMAIVADSGITECLV